MNSPRLSTRLNREPTADTGKPITFRQGRRGEEPANTQFMDLSHALIRSLGVGLEETDVICQLMGAATYSVILTSFALLFSSSYLVV